MANGKDNQEPASLGTAAALVVDLQISSSANSVASSSNSALSRTGRRSVQECSPENFARAMAHLTAMKRTAELTEVQLDTWHGALGGFAPAIVNAAVLEIALTDVRFPELGDLYQLCRAKAIKAGHLAEPYNPNGQAKKSEITSAEIRDIAGRLGLEVL